MGVWIEMTVIFIPKNSYIVTPLVGVWIEIAVIQAWQNAGVRHSPCGSVD